MSTNRSEITFTPTAPGPLHYGAPFFSFLVVLIGICTIAFTALVSIRSYTPAWYMDQWKIALDLMNHQGHYTLASLWAQHNEHRIPILDLIGLADVYLFGGRNILLLTANWAVQISQLILCSYLLKKLGDFSPTELRTLIGLTAFCLFNPNQLENFTWAFQSAFFMASFFSVAAISCVALCSTQLNEKERRLRSRVLILALICGFAAECNLASGLIVWLLLPIVALFLNLPKRTVWVIVISGLVSITIYLIGYKSPGIHTQPLDALRKPMQIFGYTQAYFGASWQLVSPRIGWIASVLAFLAVGAGWLYLSLYKDKRDPLVVSSLAIVTVCLLTACMTALGRLNFGPSQAVGAGRYQTPAMLFWCFLGISALAIVRDSPPIRAVILVCLQISTLIFFAVEARSFPNLLDEYSNLTFKKNLGIITLEAAIKDPTTETFLFPKADLPILLFNWMTQMGLLDTPFPEYDLVGTKIESEFTLMPPTECPGYVDRVLPLASGDKPAFIVDGWVNRQTLFGGPATIVLTQDDGRIVGVGVTGIQRPDVVAAGIVPSMESDSGWRGYAIPLQPARILHAYLVLTGHRKACQIAGEGRVPN